MFNHHAEPCVRTIAAALAIGFLVPLSSCSDHGGERAGDRHADEDGGGHADEVSLTPEAMERFGVRVGEARARVLTPTFAAPARVGFNTEAMAHVGSPLRGRAVEIKARLGDNVREDDPLVVIESPELGGAQAEFLLKRASAEAAAPQVEFARAALDRARGLYEDSRGVSLSEVQRREAEFKSASASLKAAQAAAVAAENGLHLLGMDQAGVAALIASGEIAPRYTIRAAIAGQVIRREITLGELVGPERESLMVLADTSTLWVLADVPEGRLQAVAPGDQAWVSAGSVGGERFEGRVAYIAPLVDPVTRTAHVRIEVPGDAWSGSIRPGMFAQVEIVAAAADDGNAAPRVVVPEASVQTVEGSPAVFVPVQGEPNTFEKRGLVVGAAVGGLVPVFAGLVEGEPFVEAGSFILKAELGKGAAAHEH